MTRELTKEETQVLVDLKSQIYSAKRYTEARNPHDLFIDAENIIGNMAYVSGIMLEFEHEYMKLKNGYCEGGDSVARADTKAQASDVYLNYRKMKSLYELGNEQVLLLKKFQSVIEMEYNSQK